MKSQIADLVNLSILNREFALSRILWALENETMISILVLNDGTKYENINILGRYSNNDKFIAKNDFGEKFEFLLDDLNLIL